MEVRVLVALAAVTVLYGCGQATSPVEKQETERGAEQAAQPDQAAQRDQAHEGTPADHAEYSVAIDLFNGKEVPAALRAVRVELVRDDDKPIESRPENLDVLNLAPRQVVRKELRGTFDKEAADAIKVGRWRSIDFVGEFPAPPILGIFGNMTYRKTVITPQDRPSIEA